MSKDFTYCKGCRCGIKEHCRRYTEGFEHTNDEESWWMDDCGDERIAYIDKDEKVQVQARAL